MNVSNKFGNRLKAARIQNDMSQIQLAEKTGLSINTIRNIEQNKNDAPIGNTIIKLAAALNVTTDYLLIGKV